MKTLPKTLYAILLAFIGHQLSAQDLIADFQFNNNLNDGTNNHTITSNGSTSFTNNQFINIQSANATLSVSSSNLLDSQDKTERSVSLKVKAPANVVAGNNILFEQGMNWSGMNVFYRSGVLYAKLWFDDGTGNPAQKVLLQHTCNLSGSFHEIDVTLKTGGDFKLYLDGVLVDSAPLAFVLRGLGGTAIGSIDGTTNYELYPNHGGAGVTNALNWQFDDVKIFNGVLSEVEILSRNSGTSVEELMTKYWAPQVYQQTREETITGPAWPPVIGDPYSYPLYSTQDLITKVDFDGNWNSGDNWNSWSTNKTNMSYFKAHAYKSFIETPTHYYLGYYYFHATDDAELFAEDRHENDMEEVIICIKKDGGYGSYEAMITQYHGDMIPYHKNGAIRTWYEADSDFLRLFGRNYQALNYFGFQNVKISTEAALDCQVQFHISSAQGVVTGKHPKIFISSNGVGFEYGHGIQAYDPAKHSAANLGGQGVVYNVNDVAQAPTSPINTTWTQHVGYKLVSINELWNRRQIGNYEPFCNNDSYNMANSLGNTQKCEGAKVPFAKKYFHDPAAYFQKAFLGHNQNLGIDSTLAYVNNNYQNPDKKVFLYTSEGASGLVAKPINDGNYNQSALQNILNPSTIKSVSIPPRHAVHFYTEGSFGTNTPNAEYGNNSFEGGKTVTLPYGLKDVLKAIKIRELGANESVTDPEESRINEDILSQGKGAGQYIMTWSGGVVEANLDAHFNDKLSGVDLAANSTIVLYNDYNFTGDATVLTNNWNHSTNISVHYRNAGMNDKTTSFRMYNTPDVVVMYDGADFKGEGGAFPNGNYYRNSFEGNIGNDHIKTIIIPPYKSITVYDHDHHTGPNYTLNNHSDSYRSFMSPMYDRITSFKVENSNANAKVAQEIILYSDYGASGSHRILPTVDGVVNFHQYFNDQTSCIRVPARTIVTLYDAIDGGGQSVTYFNESNTIKFFDLNQGQAAVINDKASSLQSWSIDENVLIANAGTNMNSRGQVFNVGNYYANNIGGVGNDEIESVTLPSGYSVQLFADNEINDNKSNIYLENTSGSYQTIVLPANHNVTSAIRYTQLPNPRTATSNFVKLHDGWNGNDETFAYPALHNSYWEMGSLNDRVTSVTIPPHKIVVLYDHWGGGNSVCISNYHNTDMTYNINSRNGALHDAATTMKVYDLNSVVELYEHSNQTGNGDAYLPGHYDLNHVKHIKHMNDKISMAYFPPHLGARFWEHNWSGGYRHIASQNAPQFIYFSTLDDKITSYHIWYEHAGAPNEEGANLNVEMTDRDDAQNALNINNIESGTFRFYPNPAHDELFVKMPRGNNEIKILNAAGQVVIQELFTDQTQLDISELQAGVYFVQFINDKGTSRVEKLLVN